MDVCQVCGAITDPGGGAWCERCTRAETREAAGILTRLAPDSYSILDAAIDRCEAQRALADRDCPACLGNGYLAYQDDPTIPCPCTQEVRA